MNNIIIEKYKDMLENPNFEQDYFFGLEQLKVFTKSDMIVLHY